MILASIHSLSQVVKVCKESPPVADFQRGQTIHIPSSLFWLELLEHRIHLAQSCTEWLAVAQGSVLGDSRFRYSNITDFCLLFRSFWQSPRVRWCKAHRYILSWRSAVCDLWNQVKSRNGWHGSQGKDLMLLLPVTDIKPDNILSFLLCECLGINGYDTKHICT